MSSLVPPRSRKTISLTALIDVVFILLMFFMLTSSFSGRFETPLQTAAAALDESPEQKEPLFLALDAQGGFHRLPEGDIANDEWLQALDDDQSLLVHPYPETEVQMIVSQLQHLQELGLSRVNLGEPLATTR